MAKRYLAFINKELGRNKIQERLYIMNDRISDSEIAFLTKQQVCFIKSLKLDPRDRPYKITMSTIFKPAFEIFRIIFKAIFGKKME